VSVGVSLALRFLGREPGVSDQKVLAVDDKIDTAHHEIAEYLQQIGQHEIDDAQGKEMFRLLAVTSTLEGIGDVAERDLVGIARKSQKSSTGLTADGKAFITAILEYLPPALATGARAAINGDPEARLVAMRQRKHLKTVTDAFEMAAFLKMKEKGVGSSRALMLEVEFADRVRAILALVKRLAKLAPKPNGGRRKKKARGKKNGTDASLED
jgi:Na+/phosphate symporter